MTHSETVYRHREMLIHCHVDAMQQLVTEMDKVAVGAAAVDDQDAAKTKKADVYVCTGHPGIRYMLFFVRYEVSPAVTKAEVC